MAAYYGQHPTGGVNIEAWTETTVSALQDLSIVPMAPAATPITPSRPVRGTATTLEIPLDADAQPNTRPVKTVAGSETAQDGTRAPPREGYARRREPLRRDSMKRREALLRGKEGSRRRQKWENDRLLGNPWMQPPSPHDWAPCPTHRVQNVPYVLAPLWDAHAVSRADKEAAKARSRTSTSGKDRVPRELRERLKRSKAAKSLLQDLEEQIRSFVADWEAKERARAGEEAVKDEAIPDETELDSADEEIVFVGRNGSMKDGALQREEMERRRMQEEHDKLARDKLVFETPADDHGASFGRWLVHTIAGYYDLRTWSVTTGDPARREAYVGIKSTALSSGCQATSQLPRPLWGMI